MADALKCDRCGCFYTFDDKSLRPSANKKNTKLVESVLCRQTGIAFLIWTCVLLAQLNLCDF